MNIKFLFALLPLHVAPVSDGELFGTGTASEPGCPAPRRRVGWWCSWPLQTPCLVLGKMKPRRNCLRSLSKLRVEVRLFCSFPTGCHLSSLPFNTAWKKSNHQNRLEDTHDLENRCGLETSHSHSPACVHAAK